MSGVHMYGVTLRVFEELEGPKPTDWRAPSTWDKYEKHAKLTADVDFACGFDQKGRCKRGRDYKGTYKDEGKNCCYGCASNFGYLEAIRPGTAYKYNQLFNHVDGFWRRGVGCMLPREMRSTTCLTYSCYGTTDMHKLIQLGVVEKKKNIA